MKGWFIQADLNPFLARTYPLQGWELCTGQQLWCKPPEFSLLKFSTSSPHLSALQLPVLGTSNPSAAPNFCQRDSHIQSQALEIFLPLPQTCATPPNNSLGHLICTHWPLQLPAPRVLCSSWLDTGVPPPFTLQRLSGPFSPSQMPPVRWMVLLPSRSHLQQPAGTTAHMHGALCAGGAERLHPRTPELPHGIALSTPQISIKLCSRSGDAWLEPSKPQMGVRCVCLVHG